MKAFNGPRLRYLACNVSADSLLKLAPLPTCQRRRGSCIGCTGRVWACCIGRCRASCVGSTATGSLDACCTSCRRGSCTGYTRRVWACRIGCFRGSRVGSTGTGSVDARRTWRRRRFCIGYTWRVWACRVGRCRGSCVGSTGRVDAWRIGLRCRCNLAPQSCGDPASDIAVPLLLSLVNSIILLSLLTRVIAQRRHVPARDLTRNVGTQISLGCSLVLRTRRNIIDRRIHPRRWWNIRRTLRRRWRSTLRRR